MKRLIEQTACEHGKWEDHRIEGSVQELCFGGSSREVAVDVLSACLYAIWQRGFYGEGWDESWPDDFVAALGGGL